MTKLFTSLLAATLIGWGPAGQQQTFRARSVGVRVFVQVGDKRHTVTSLSAADFVVVDDGIAQVPVLVLPVTHLNLIVVVDTSLSMRTTAFNPLAQTAAALADSLAPDDQVAVVSASDHAHLEHELTTDHAQARTAILSATSLPAGFVPRSAIWDAVLTAASLSDDDGRPLILLASDGFDNGSWISADVLVKTLSRSAAVVDLLQPAGPIRCCEDGPAPGPRRGADDVAHHTGGEVYRASDSGTPLKFSKQLEGLRSGYVIGYSPQGATRAGWHRVDVRSNRPDVKIEGTTVYYVGR